MPKVRTLTAEARMDQQLLAAIDKYKRLANVTRYGDLGPRMGRSLWQSGSAFALTHYGTVCSGTYGQKERFAKGSA